MDLSIKRREIKAVETKIKDHLLLMGMSDVWRDAERIRKESERAHQQYLKDIHKKRKERQQRMKIVLLFFYCLFFRVYRLVRLVLYESFTRSKIRFLQNKD